jgi:hypothetical protein
MRLVKVPRLSLEQINYKSLVFSSFVLTNLNIMPAPAVYVMAVVGSVGVAIAFKQVFLTLFSLHCIVVDFI